MRTIAIINQKGGCGKTTTSINLAACLARLGQRTLLVDMDPQGHCGVGLAVPEDQIERTIFDTLIEERDGRVAKISEVVWQIASDFDLAPSNLKLAAFEQVFSGRPGREDRLTKALESASNYQWCIVDCPPSVGLITFNALRACDEAIVPVETGYFSLHGLTKMMETLEEMRERCNKVINIRVLPTLYDTRTKLAREVLSELRAKFREYLMESTVNFNTKLKEAASFGQPITEYDPGSRGYKDFVNLARELMGHRPAEVEPVVEKLSRPQELVQRAKQLSQLSQFQFKGTAIPAPAATPAASMPSPSIPEPAVETSIAPSLSPSLSMSLSLPESLAGTGESIPRFAIDPPALRTSSTNPDPFVPSAMASKPAATRSQAPVPDDRTTLRLSDSSLSISPTSLRPSLFLSSQPVVAPAMTVSRTPAKTTEQKIEEFYGVRQLGSEVLFTSKFETARQVLVAGDFNNWSPMVTPMHRNGRPGEWTMMLPLMPGRYRYRLVVDGRWMTDPHNKYVEVNQFGELNNIVEVE
jgi:cellulose biosynthesis protein BcsQ